MRPSGQNQIKKVSRVGVGEHQKSVKCAISPFFGLIGIFRMYILRDCWWIAKRYSGWGWVSMINPSNVPPHLNLYPVKAVWILSNTKTFMQRLLDRVIGMCVVKKKYGEGVCVYVIWGLREVYVQCVRWALSETRKVENISDSSFEVGLRKKQEL